MIIERRSDLKNIMSGKTVLITGAGGGIGLEAAKTFAYMGAKIIIAEIDKEKGAAAQGIINGLFDGEPAKFYLVDLADEKQIKEMTKEILLKYGCPDVVFNNATITRMGAVDEVDISFWDNSYAVNLKAPILLAQTFLPYMKTRDSGVLVFVSSSGASPYMGAYEVFKTAQVELGNTLAMELEHSHIYAYTIGPGLVKTDTAAGAIRIISAKMGMSLEEFYLMNQSHIISADDAGAGFALSVLKAESYHGQEISSIQVLMDYGLTEQAPEQITDTNLQSRSEEIKELVKRIYQTYEEQSNAWKAMNLFEKQWVLRDFKKSTGLSTEQAGEKLRIINSRVQSGDLPAIASEREFFRLLGEYWKHQLKLLQSYEKNRDKLEKNSRIIEGWMQDINKVLNENN